MHFEGFLSGHRCKIGSDQGKAATGMALELVIKPELDHAEVVVSDDGMKSALDMLGRSLAHVRAAHY